MYRERTSNPSIEPTCPRQAGSRSECQTLGVSMLSRRAISIIIAVASGIAPTVAAIAWVPIVFLFGMGSLTEEPLAAAAFFTMGAASSISVVNYWYLAVRTVRGQPYGSIWIFALATLCACVAVAAIVWALPPGRAAALSLPFVAVSFLFSWRQYAEIRPSREMQSQK